MNKNLLTKEIAYQFARSSGAGGQHVNKVSTKVILRFNIPNSTALNTEEKETILLKLSSRISKDGDIILSSQTSKSQYKNKAIVCERFMNLIQHVLTPKKQRYKTKRTLKSVKRRLESKSNRGDIKKLRRKPEL